LADFLGVYNKRWWLYRAFSAPTAEKKSLDEFNVFEQQLAGVDTLFVQHKSIVYR